MKSEKVSIYHNEVFKEIEMDASVKLRYAISNLGRVISYSDDMSKGRLLKGGITEGYHVVRFNVYRDGKVTRKQLFIYKLIAQYFIPKKSDDQVCVLHLDYIRNNDVIRNLKWATREEWQEHINKSPFLIQSRKNFIENNRKSDGSKLTVTRVMLIKKLLANPNRKTRLKMIAKQFGVSEMQIRRIQSGENWGHLKV